MTYTDCTMAEWKDQSEIIRKGISDALDMVQNNYVVTKALEAAFAGLVAANAAMEAATATPEPGAQMR